MYNFNFSWVPWEESRRGREERRRQEEREREGRGREEREEGRERKGCQDGIADGRHFAVAGRVAESVR